MEMKFYNPILTPEGLQTLDQIGNRMDPRDLATLISGISELERYNGLLNAAATGELESIRAFGEMILGCPLPDEPLLGGGNLLQRREPETPFTVYMPQPITFFFAGLNAANALGTGEEYDPQRGGGDIKGPLFPPDLPFSAENQAVFAWVDRAFTGWAARAVSIEMAIDAGRRWLDGGEIDNLRGRIDALHNPCGLLPPKGVPLPSLDERQVCISEFVFTAMRLGSKLGRPSFPQIGSITPFDQCLSSAGPITLYPPPGKQFPPQSNSSSDPSPAIDRRPTNILSWTSGQIQLELPAGLAAGCHVVGWIYLYPPDVVSQLRNIGEMCRPWFGGNSLMQAPYMIWDDQARFSLVTAPTIETFHGPGGSTAVRAEACTPVTLSWSTTIAACSGTAAQLAVMLFRDGQLFRVALPPSGQVTVSDPIIRTYRLRAQARLSGTLCGQSESSLTVDRFNVLQVQIQGNARCLQPGTGISLNVQISCPAPVGGLGVTITSSHPNRVSGVTAVIPEGNTSASIEVVAGSTCGTAVLTVAVPDHPPTQVSITVADTPIISAVTPGGFQTCDPVTLTVDGTCLGETAGEITAVLDGNGQQISGTVTIVNPGTQIQVVFPPLAPGAYMLAVRHCGQVGFPPGPITVTNHAPAISPPTTTPTSVEACTTPSVKIQWQTSFATKVQVKRGAVIVVERNYTDPCANISDSFTDNLPSVSGPVTYTLTAFNPDGAMTTSSKILPLTSANPLASAFVVQNTSGSQVNVFLVNAENNGGSLVGTLATNAVLTIPLPSCRLRSIISIDPKQVADYNARWGTNYSATDVITARTGGPWTRTSTPYALGLGTAGLLGIIPV